MSDWPRNPVDLKREPWSAWLYFTHNEKMEGYVKIGSANSANKSVEPGAMREYLEERQGASSLVYSFFWVLI